MKIKTIIHKAEEGGFWVEIPAFKGCVSQGDSLEEALENIKEAAEGWIEVMTEKKKMEEDCQLEEIEL